MLVVTPFHPGDADQALRLFNWIRDLGGTMGHSLLLIADTRCSQETVDEIVLSAGASFKAVEVLPFTDHFQKWPEAPNAAFAFVARHIREHQKTPWLLLEPDCAPLRAGWLDAIEREYLAAGKPFMGARVEVENVPLHMSGNAVYPADMIAHAGIALIAGDIAWDVAAASQIVPQAHFTKLIVHNWKHPPFNDQGEVGNVLKQHPEAVLFHADKSGSLIRLLSDRRKGIPHREGASDAASGGVPEANSIGVSQERVKIETQTATTLARPSGFSCDIFIKSYPADYEWLSYCLRSVEQFAIDFKQTVIVMPREHPPVPGFDPYSLMGDHRYRIIEVDESGDGYLFQQAVKLRAHEYTDASHILFLDSDTIFTRPVTPQTYMAGDITGYKIGWLMTPWHQTDTPWRPSVEKFLCQPVEFEFMRRHPFMIPRWLLVALGEFCQQKHDMSIEQYIMSQSNRDFSEFNVLGAFAYAFHRDKFYWINTDTQPDEIPELTVLQKFSWGGLTDEIRAEFEAILSGTNGEQQPNGPNVDPLPAQTFVDDLYWVGSPDGSPERVGESRLTNADLERAADALIPWHSTEQSIERILGLAIELQKFCTGGARTRRVREELHRLGVVELQYRFKKRRKWRKRNKTTTRR